MKQFIATIACLLLGPFFSWQGASDLIIASRSRSWPTIDGVVKSSDMKESRGRRGRTTYTPVVKYAYEVEGVSYTGDRIDTGDRGSSSMGDALERLTQYSKGDSVIVHYDPKQPSESLLEVGTQNDNWIVLGIGLVMTVFGAISGRALWQRFQSNDFRPAGGF